MAVAIDDTTSNTATTNQLVIAITGGTNMWFVVFCCIKSSNAGGSVSGGGLTWTTTLIPGARGQIDGILSTAFGSPSDFDVTIDVTAANSMAGAVARISGGDASSLGSVATSNTSGQPATVESGGTDSSTTTIDTTSTVDNSMILVGLGSREGRAIDTADVSYTEADAAVTAIGSNGCRMYLHYLTLGTAGTDTCSHTLSNTSDWMHGGVAIAPASGGGGGGGSKPRLWKAGLTGLQRQQTRKLWAFNGVMWTPAAA